MQSFGPFLLIDALASGGMGEVWLASPQGLRTATEELCVLKRVKSVLADDDDAVRRFIDESRLGLLLRHPCVSRTLDAGRADGSDYLAVQLVEGIDLRVMMERAQGANVTIDPTLALWCLASGLDGLAYAHGARHPLTGAPLGVVHRDISPHNLMAARDGITRVIDFGLAVSSVREARTEQGVVMGKLAYMSPEQARGDVIDDRSDVFAAGVVLYELIAGERFWGGRTMSAIWQLVGAGSFRPDHADAVDAVTAGLFSQMTDRNAAARPTAAEARDIMLGLIERSGGIDDASRRLAAMVRQLAAPELARMDQARDRAHQVAPTISEMPRTTISIALTEVAAVEALLQAAQPTITRQAPTTTRVPPGVMAQASTMLMARAVPTQMVTRVALPSLPSPPSPPPPAPRVSVPLSPSPSPPAPSASSTHGLRRSVVFAVVGGISLLAVGIGVGLGLRSGPPPVTPVLVVAPPPVVAPPVVAPPVPPPVAPPAPVPPIETPVDVAPVKAGRDPILVEIERLQRQCRHACVGNFINAASLSPALRLKLKGPVANCRKTCGL